MGVGHGRYILNSRYNEQRTTIITTNFPDGPSGKAEEEISRLKKSREEADARSGSREETPGDRITDRMRSRLHDMCRVRTLKGPDFRTLQKTDLIWFHVIYTATMSGYWM